MDQDQNENERHDKSFSPRGAFLFVLLMMAGYILYWASIYYTVIIERGA